VHERRRGGFQLPCREARRSWRNCRQNLLEVLVPFLRLFLRDNQPVRMGFRRHQESRISRTLTNSSSSLFQLNLLSTSSSVYHSSFCFSVVIMIAAPSGNYKERLILLSSIQNSSEPLWTADVSKRYLNRMMKMVQHFRREPLPRPIVVGVVLEHASLHRLLTYSKNLSTRTSLLLSTSARPASRRRKRNARPRKQNARRKRKRPRAFSTSMSRTLRQRRRRVGLGL